MLVSCTYEEVFLFLSFEVETFLSEDCVKSHCSTQSGYCARFQSVDIGWSVDLVHGMKNGFFWGVTCNREKCNVRELGNWEY